MSKLRIYLTNLTHVNNENAATETIPLNIGFLAAYAQKAFGDSVHIELFNLYSELEKAIERREPHILGVSNYSWNANLGYHCLSHFKRKLSKMITVMGGPNYSSTPKLKEAFLKERESLDFYIEGEGEVAFKIMLEACFKHDLDIRKIKSEKITGCHYLVDESLVSSSVSRRLSDLDSIPSPYIEGLLDCFLEQGFTPIIQTNRGCPFSCAFCYSGTDYYNRVSFFSIERVTEEIEYIARRVKSPTIHLHDSNFGMFPRDYKICEVFKRAQKEYDWPTFICTATGKNNKERIIDCVELLGVSIPFSASVQSTSNVVLKNIGRINLSMNDMHEIQDKLKYHGGDSLSEFILPLPGETLESHMAGLKDMMSKGIDAIDPYTTIMLPGSALYEDEKFKKFDMDIKYRVIPRDFGKYNGVNVVEVEGVCVATNSLSVDEYIYARQIHFIIYCFYNKGTIKELFSYLRFLGIEPFDYCEFLMSHIDMAPEKVQACFRQFTEDTKKELWDSTAEIYERYRDDDNFNQLVNLEEGFNLLQKNQGFFYSNFRVFLEFAIEMSKRFCDQRRINFDPDIIDSISSYILHSRSDLFSADESMCTAQMPFDIHAWRQEGYLPTIDQYRKKMTLQFYHTEEQRKLIDDYITTFGRTTDSFGKIFTRVNPRSLFRRTSYLQS